MKNYKILFADLDGTLIKTKSGETFPKGIWDMEFRFEVLDTIKKLKPEFLLIVSNQGGIELRHIIECNFEDKLNYIGSAIEEYCPYTIVYIDYCKYNDKANPNRKPNVGMLNSLIQENITPNIDWVRNDCLMIGDASGKEGQFSDTDKKTAENFGCDYLDVEDFVKLVNEE